MLLLIVILYLKTSDQLKQPKELYLIAIDWYIKANYISSDIYERDRQWALVRSER